MLDSLHYYVCCCCRRCRGWLVTGERSLSLCNRLRGIFLTLPVARWRRFYTTRAANICSDGCCTAAQAGETLCDFAQTLRNARKIAVVVSGRRASMSAWMAASMNGARSGFIVVVVLLGFSRWLA
jgi:hypothetical protein